MSTSSETRDVNVPGKGYTPTRTLYLLPYTLVYLQWEGLTSVISRATLSHPSTIPYPAQHLPSFGIRTSSTYRIQLRIPIFNRGDDSKFIFLPTSSSPRRGYQRKYARS